MKQQVASIQYLRAFGALAVVASHADHSALLGQSGVDLFFVISGFIMWTMRGAAGPAAFLWHRILRVVPLYWAATLVMAVHQRASWSDILHSLFFIPYVGVHGEIWPVLVQGWTLNYEMFFYLLMAASLVLPRRAALPALVGTITGLSLAHALVPGADAVLMTYTNPLMLEFAAGIGLAELWRRRLLPHPVAAPALAVVAALALWLPGWTDVPETWRFLAWGLPMAMLVTAGLSLEAAGRVPRLRPLLALGDASYSIYLCHPFLMTRVTRMAAQFGMPMRMAAALVAAAVVGLLLHRWFERPVTAGLRRISARLAPARRHRHAAPDLHGYAVRRRGD